MTVKKFTPQEALAIFVEGDFTNRQWEVIQNATKNAYPCFSLIKKNKGECYPDKESNPDKESMQVNETCAEIQLEALFGHTVIRLYKYIAEVLETCSEEEKQNIVLISK